ncbi:phosphatidylserine decarboxylase [Platysternon megacephalum]|uniref:Phosphatidylserine decarboxylase n=1 Tax=Platysternon megacephalum TaxID=55544 RepID=A0A4D9DVF1_9SAUR|nr:phosphatidylserine decarboxylase [Platysternon megacephalum]
MTVVPAQCPALCTADAQHAGLRDFKYCLNNISHLPANLAQPGHLQHHGAAESASRFSHHCKGLLLPPGGKAPLQTQQWLKSTKGGGGRGRSESPIRTSHTDGTDCSL